MVKTNLKRIISILLLLMVAICFSACSQVTVMTVTNEDGTIDELVSVTLDRGIIAESGENYDAIHEDIELCGFNEAKQIVYQFNNKLETDKFLATKETYEILSSFNNGVTVVGNKWQDDTYTIGVRFKNIDVYRYYYGISEEVEVQTTTEKHFLYDKVSYRAYTMYVSRGDLYNRLSAYFSKYDAFNVEDTELVYTYVTDSSRQHSDADYIIRQQGKFYHSWVVDETNEVVTFYYNIANRTNWIIVCIGIALLLTIFISIIAIIKNNLNKSKINKNN